MEKRQFFVTFLRFFIVFGHIFVHDYILRKRMSTKLTYLCFALNFGELDNHGYPEGVVIVFLYKPGTDG